jgi:hypothetical protein
MHQQQFSVDELRQRLYHGTNATGSDFNGVKELQLQEYPLFLNNKVLLSNYPELVTSMLTQFFKRLLKNEGVIEEQDDIFRIIYI